MKETTCGDCRFYAVASGIGVCTFCYKTDDDRDGKIDTTSDFVLCCKNFEKKTSPMAIASDR